MMLVPIPAWLIVTSSMLVGTPTEDQLTVSLQLSVSASRVHVLVACSWPTPPVRVTRQGGGHHRSGGGLAGGVVGGATGWEGGQWGGGLAGRRGPRGSRPRRATDLRPSRRAPGRSRAR